MKKQQNTISHYKVITISFLVDISDVLINVVVSALSGSVTMLSQALQGAIGLLASGFLYIGSRRARRRADIHHPFGYGRELYFWTFLSGLVMIGVTATFSFYWGLMRYLNPEPISNLGFAYVALLISIVTNGYAFSLSFRRLIADKPKVSILKIFFQSPLIATKTTLLLDLMGTLASVFGLVAFFFYSFFGDMRFDGVGAMVVGISLAFFSFFILRDVRAMIIGTSASSDVKDAIRRSIATFSQVKSVVELKVMHIGVERLFVLAEIHIVDRLKTDDIEQLIDSIREKVQHDVPEAVYVHIEPETP